ncbi:MAG: hypothetical protein M1827_003325 [Pycnora praestabilis]|nr:MAG: hypothetical protein M1827_003325 [Pycnora praestabilis]
MNSPSPDPSSTEEMFPSANDPPTPTNNPLLQRYQQRAELSPPTSQDPVGGDAVPDTMDHVNSNNGASGANGFQGNGARPGLHSDKAKHRVEEDQPGWIWMNKRAQEEYAKAMETLIIEPGFKERYRALGDPFLEDDMLLSGDPFAKKESKKL